MSQKSRNSRFSMILSIIIVNYRVPYFLELCLHSAGKALEGIDAEIIVADNHSADGSLEFLQPLFPAVKWIANPENEGFARANNQALRQSTGDYVLFLNPDTILPEDFARKVLAFISSIPNAGGIGVRMIDGSGRFLKESRRGFPSPWVAFCKLSGLTTLFPRTRRFAQYYLGYLPSDLNTPAPVLSGACLLVSRTVLAHAGPFDERFFMYAEDIDLSYRLEKAGYTNHYFAGTTIIHFKGESTRKDIRYTRQFYKAMIRFRRLHFNSGRQALFRVLLEPAIWLRAGISTLGRVITPRRPNPRRRPNLHPPSSFRRVWLTGDPEGIGHLQSALAPSQLSPDEPGAREIIYCIGREFSFKSAIQALGDNPPGRTAAFYAAGCHAVISSSRRDNQGKVWILQR